MFFHKRHIPTPAAEATPAEEGRTEAASEEDVVTLEEPQLKEQWRLDRLERRIDKVDGELEKVKGRVYSTFLYERHIPTPAAEAMLAEEGKEEVGSEEDEATLEESWVME